MPGILSKNEIQQEDQPVEIAIVGGGIIGLILALGLIKCGVKVKIFEQAGSLREIGAGVAFTANAVQCMGKIDQSIVKCLRAVATANGDADAPNDWLRYVDGFNKVSDDPTEEKLLFKLYAGYRGFEGCHRAHFLAELVKVIPKDVVEFRKRLEDISQESENGKLTMKFVDGSTAQADAVIGCDGIKSRVRQILLGKDNPASYPHYTHKFCYRGLIPMDKAIELLGDYKARNQHMHVGPNAHMLHFPVAGQTLVNLAAFVSDPNDWPLEHGMVKHATREDVEEAFSGFGQTCRNIASLLPDELDKWAIFDMYDYPAASYNQGRICIAGDAAHASAPHHGAGAGIGVEDALCISTLMNSALDLIGKGSLSKNEALAAAFDTFSTVRKERSQWLVNSSHGICDVYEWADPVTGDDPEKCFKEVEWRSHKIWYFDIDGMLKTTNETYQEKVASLGAGEEVIDGELKTTNDTYLEKVTSVNSVEEVIVA